jgi:chorismate mutase / prephenate dehydratase
MAKKRKSSKDAPPSHKELVSIDRQIAELLSDRAEASRNLAGEASKTALPSNPGPLTDRAFIAIFREIEAACRQLSLPQRVAYLGPEHTFSHIAAVAQFGQSSELVPVGSIGAVFDEVEQGLAQYGMVPLENSTDGRVTDTLEGFARSAVRICGEVPLAIHHALLGKGPRGKIRQVASKPQALSQCRNWLAKHLPQAELVAVGSTADAALRAADDPATGAIASHQAGVEYGLKVLAPAIEDNPDNVTRFAVIAQQPAPRTGRDKTSLMLEIAHQPGALADVMAIFKRARLNLTWIESFPMSGQRGRYLFFIEFLGHAQDVRARRALTSLEKKVTRLVVLGSYAQVNSAE